MSSLTIAAPQRQTHRWSQALTQFGLPGFLVVILALATVLPIMALLVRAFYDRSGAFVGIANFIRYATEPGLSIAAWNSTLLSGLATVIVLVLAYPVAYALTRSCMPLKGLFRLLMLLPLLAPSLLPAISFIYLFGNQGFLKGLMFGGTIYGPIGIVIAQIFYCFPQALIIIVAALALADARLAARTVARPGRH